MSKAQVQIQVLRHHLFDRLMHWAFALCIMFLLLSGLLPQLGFDFPWIDPHWICGLVLLGLTLIHVIRSTYKLFTQKQGASMLPVPDDFSGKRPAKYSLAQKLMHDSVAVIALTGIVTGLLLTVRIDTGLWARDPYWLAVETWGIIYVLHGLVALCFVSLIMFHVYFALRPEKRLYLRAMKSGNISREEYQREHDPERWPVNGTE